MALNLRDNLIGLKHYMIGGVRQIMSYPPDRFIQVIRNHGFDANDVGEKCPMCGYSRTLINLPNGWSLEGCSATESQKLIGQKKFLELFADNLVKSEADTDLPRSTV